MSGAAGGTTVAAFGGVAADRATASALEARAAVLEMTARAEAAVLTPEDPGAWSHALRAALAARSARLHGLPDLAARYEAVAGTGPGAALADPAETGAALGLAAVVAFMDRVAAVPRDVSADDVVALQAAGIGDADIVRLAELNAFLAYQFRVVAGLRLLARPEGAR